MVNKLRLDRDFWEDRYNNNQTQWDVTYITDPLKNYIDQLENKEIDVLIPGGGFGYELDYFLQKGFKKVTHLDIASAALEKIKKRLPDSDAYLAHQDFFEHQGAYDLILEQTFFCALDPSLRKNYAKKMHKLIKPKGKLVGLLFDFPLTEQGPPFGGNLEEYVSTFKNFFQVKTLQRCYNSIPARADRELFFIFEKK